MEDSSRIEEEQKLDLTISRIDEIIAKDKLWLGMSKGEASITGEAASEMRRRKEQNIRNLEEARPNPYFGRVDFAEDVSPDEIETYYFGKYHIPLDYVYSWQVPIARLFYQPLSGEYEAPIGRITGTVKLKRELLIEQARLVELTDYRLLPPGVGPAPIEEASLTRELSKSRGYELRDIVTTIRPEQYEEIAATLQQVMIIQGVAGSGKSEVGLHRLAYLLSPHNELNLKISPKGVIFIGPSKVFLRYISNLLPGLDVEGVNQTTIRDWLRSTLSSPVRLEPRDGLLEKQLTGTKKMLEGEQRVAKLKSSMQMARLIDKHVQMLREGFLKNATNLMFRQEIVMSEARVRNIIRGTRGDPLNVQRKRVLSEIEGQLRKKSVIKPEESLPSEVEAQLEKFWPELNYKDAYIRLLSDRNALLAASKGSVTEYEADLIGKSLSGKSKMFRIVDLPALCHLDHSLNDRENVRKRGRIVPTFEHVVIDEAQDVSPLELLLLYRHSSNKAFTILGDIGQCFLPHRGITNWREVKQVFSKETVRRWDARISYRATYELTTYANRILRKVMPGVPRAIPYRRHGEEPAFTRSKSYTDMVTAIAKDIKSLQGQNVQTIAILCKTLKEASSLQKRLIKAGIEDIVLLDKQRAYQAKVVIASIYLTKGIEYDAVILANARKNNYPNSVLHSKLLYIAVTRAAHRLHIHWFGTLADVLVAPGLFPKKEDKRAKKRKRGKRRKTVSEIRTS